MKRMLGWMVFSLLLGAMFAPLHAEQKTRSFTLIYTNNTMGRIEPCRH